MKHLFLAAAAVGLLAACSDYDPGLSEEVVDYTEEELAVISEYEANFIERYGTIDADHTWGFGEKGSEDETRATRSVNVNRNEWDHAVKEDGVIVDYTTWTNLEGQTMIVPGFPSAVDGLYYIEEAVEVEEGRYEQRNTANTLEDLIAKGKDSYNPVGDVTDEEIQYVSEWFRTHPNPDSEVPQFTEFYIQDISQDYDRVSYPNGDAIDKNLQVYVGGQPDPEHPGFYKDGELDGGTEPIVFGMDYFAVQTSNGEWEHENNFNAQKTNKIDGVNPTNSTVFPNRTLKYWYSGHYEWPDGVQTLMSNGYTTSFMYHNSDNNTNYENYVLVHLSFDGPRTGNHYDGYYLAFDYQFVDLQETHVDDEGNVSYKYAQRLPDGYYSNWIVKLAPATPSTEPEHNWYRIMCEDLGNTDDFDFNDLVYDVYYTGEAPNYQAHIRVQASGGVLPIYLGYDDNPAYETHRLFGQEPNAVGRFQPINVGGVKADPVDIVLNVSTTDPNDIPIYVYGVDASGTRSTTLLPKAGGTEISSAPQKICIPGNKTKWLKERVQIETGYPYFDEWVKNEFGPYGFEGATPWNKTEVKESALWSR